MIIFDLDGTIANCDHRRHFVEPGLNDSVKWKKNLDGYLKGWYRSSTEKWEPDWDAFYEACDQDQPIEHVIEMMDGIYFNSSDENRFLQNLQIWSGRSESVRVKTLDWFREFVLFDNVTDRMTIKMRPIGDYTPDDQLKERWLDEAIAEGKKVDYVFDDRPKVIRMWRRRGIFVFDCNQTGEEF